MHKIKPYSEYIQSELVKFIEAEPNQWQAKVIACLGFRVIYSFKEITERLSLSPVFILKTLLVAEKFGVVTYANDGWIINSKLNIGNLNEFLSLDIPDYDIGNNERMIYFLKHGFLDEKKELSAGPVLTEIEKKQSVDVIKKRPTSNMRARSEAFDLTIESSTRPIDGSGRKRKKEWNQSEALDFGRQLQKLIQERKREEQSSQLESKRLPEKEKRDKLRKMTASNEGIASEQLYIKLCTLYPEYEAYITRHHEKDPSYKMMRLIERKILSDYNET